MPVSPSIGVSGPDLALLRSDTGPDDVDIGEETIDRFMATSAVGLSSGVLALTFFNARKSEMITQTEIVLGGMAGAGNTVAQVGVYSVAQNGDGVLIASTPIESTTVFAANQVVFYSAPYTKVQGRRYARGVLAVGGTMPQMVGRPCPTTSVGMIWARAPRRIGSVGGRVAMPASFSDATLYVAAGHAAMLALELP